jgi:hypothetical protein
MREVNFSAAGNTSSAQKKDKIRKIYHILYGCAKKKEKGMKLEEYQITKRIDNFKVI